MPLEKETFNTTYFDEETVRLAVGGCCHDFAIALHRRKGWKLACLWQLPTKDKFTIFHDRMPMHVFCILPDGRGIDVEGPDEIESIQKRYIGLRTDREYELDTYLDEKAYEAAFEKELGSARSLLPREHGIEGAEKVIKKSKKFLALLNELKAA